MLFLCFFLVKEFLYNLSIATISKGFYQINLKCLVTVVRIEALNNIICLSSIEAVNIYDEDQFDLFLQSKADLVVSCINAHIDILQMGLNNPEDLWQMDNLVQGSIFMISQHFKVTKALGTFDMGTIISFQTYKKRNIFGFISTFDKYSLLATFVLSFFVALVTSVKNIRFYHKYFENIIYGLFLKSDLNLNIRFPFLFVLWLTFMWIFRQLYGGDMLSAMMKCKTATGFDSVEALLKRPDVTIMTVTTKILQTEGNDEDQNYWALPPEHIKELKPRLEIHNYLRESQFEESAIAIADSLIKHGEFNRAGMAPRDLGLFAKNSLANGKYKDYVYVSPISVNVQPYFFLKTVYTSDEEGRVIDYV